MNFYNVVKAIAIAHRGEISAEDIEKTVELLTDCSILEDVEVLKKIANSLAAEVAYEESKVSDEEDDQ